MTPEQVTDIIEEHKKEIYASDKAYDASNIASNIPDTEIDDAVDVYFEPWQTIVWDKVSSVKTASGTTYSAVQYKKNLLKKKWWDGTSDITFILNGDGNVSHIQCFDPENGVGFSDNAKAGNWGVAFLTDAISEKKAVAKAKVAIRLYEEGE